MASSIPASVPVLVTGASSGIGEEFARRFAARGHDVTLVARRVDRLERLAAELTAAHGITATPVAADLEKPADRKRIAALLAKGPWVLVNNAGYGTRGAFGDGLDAAREAAMVTLNCVAVTELAAAVLPANLAAGTGGLINLASTASFQPVPYMAAYAATKAFVLHFTEGIAAEHRKSGVRIMALCPGATRTEFGEVTGNAQELELLFPMDTDKCVDIALKAFDRGHTICVPGWRNSAGAFAPRLAPRALVRRVLEPVFAPRTSERLLKARGGRGPAAKRSPSKAATRPRRGS
jgi:short-subunit dehydrogenase